MDTRNGLISSGSPCDRTHKHLQLSVLPDKLRHPSSSHRVERCMAGPSNAPRKKIIPGSLANNDSDGDSGIDSTSSGQRGHRGSSSSSTDADQDVVIRALTTIRSKEPGKHICLRRETKICQGNTQQPDQNKHPVKADHTLFQQTSSTDDTIQTHRRNSVAGISQSWSLSSLPDQIEHIPQRVRFDDGLRLSEQSIRSSCRKFFSNYSLSGYVPARNGQQPSSSANSTPRRIKTDGPSNGCVQKRPLCIKLRGHPPPVHKNRIQKTKSYCGLNRQEVDNQPNPIASTSCQSLDRNVVKDEKNNCVLYSENMINVYARLASALPDENYAPGTQQHERNAKRDIPGTNAGSKSSDSRVEKLLEEHRTLVPSNRWNVGMELNRDTGCVIEQGTGLMINEELPATECCGSAGSLKALQQNGVLLSQSPPTRHCPAAKPSSKGQQTSYKRQGTSQMCSSSSSSSSNSSPSKQPSGMCDSGPINQRGCMSNESCWVSYPELRQCMSYPRLDQFSSPEHQHSDINNINRSDLDIFRGSNNKRRNLTWRLQTLKNSAKCAVLKAFSSEKPPKTKALAKNNRGFIGTIRNSFRRKKKSATDEQMSLKSGGASEKAKEIPVTGHILHINRDGSQIIEIESVEDHSPIFTVAKAKDTEGKGVLITRMPNAEVRRRLIGLLDVGDQILEIENEPVCHISIEVVNKIIIQKRKIQMKIMPFMYSTDF